MNPLESTYLFPQANMGRSAENRPIIIFILLPPLLASPIINPRSRYLSYMYIVYWANIS